MASAAPVDKDDGAASSPAPSSASTDVGDDSSSSASSSGGAGGGGLAPLVKEPQYIEKCGVVRVIVPLPRLKSFCHATVAGSTAYVSGTIGLEVGSDGVPTLAKGGVGPQTTRTLECIKIILEACGLTLGHLTKVNVSLHNFTKERAAEMDDAYRNFFGGEPVPARITVGVVGLALGADVEIDAVAHVDAAGAAFLIGKSE